MHEIRVLINATTIKNGGGVQAAISMIEYVTSENVPDIHFAFALSEAIAKDLPVQLLDQIKVTIFETSPSILIGGLLSRRRLKKLEVDFSPHVVYSIGFPSYVKFKSLEVGRYTNPWEVQDLDAAWSQMGLIAKLKRKMRTLYRRRWAKNADVFETQTETAKEGIVKHFQRGNKEIFVIPNSVNPRFLKSVQPFEIHNSHPEIAQIFCLAADHWHKNLKIIPHVAKHLDTMGLRAQFKLTLPETSQTLSDVCKQAEKNGTSEMIVNLGTLTLDDCLKEYQRSTCVFLPTLAEVFSATYLEAMAMQVPIVTSDLDFANDVCGSAAAYFETNDAKSAAETLALVIQSQPYKHQLVSNGKKRLRVYPTPPDKHRQVLDMLVSVYQAKDKFKPQIR